MTRSIALLAGFTAVLVACSDAGEVRAVRGGDAGRGRVALQRFDCEACHVIPGVRGLSGQVGPSLAGFASRPYLAGKFVNSEAMLIRWLMDPPALAPHTAMPDTGVDEAQARDMAAYLFTLQ